MSTHDLQNDRLPKAGDLNICTVCQKRSEFGPDLKLRPISDAQDIMDFMKNPEAYLEQKQNAALISETDVMLPFVLRHERRKNAT